MAELNRGATLLIVYWLVARAQSRRRLWRPSAGRRERDVAGPPATEMAAQTMRAGGWRRGRGDKRTGVWRPGVDGGTVTVSDN